MIIILFSILTLLFAVVFWMLKMVEHQEYIAMLKKSKNSLNSLFLNLQFDTLVKIAFPLFSSDSRATSPKAQSIAKRIKVYLVIFYLCLLTYTVIIIAYTMKVDQ